MDRELVEQLSAEATRLIGKMTELQEQSGIAVVNLAKRADENLNLIKKNARLTRLVIIGLVADILLTVATIFGGLNIISNADRIDTLTQQLRTAQTTTQYRVLCPLYTLFVAAEQQPPPPGETPAQQVQREAAIKVINDGYNVLGCANQLPSTSGTGQLAK